MRNIALVDNDFMHKIASIVMQESEWISLVGRLFHDLGCIAGVHSLVYINEMMDVSAPEHGKNRIKSLTEKEMLLIQDLNKILYDDDLRNYYKIVFMEICNEYYGEVPIEDIFTQWKRNCSLGEIHSITMCVLFEFGIFLSDDIGSKTIARSVVENKLCPNTIIVYSREDAIDYINSSVHSTLKKNEKRMIKSQRK
ncbi:hypothetical protein [Pseudobutyrivibrio sp.]|uniref:hypothetical protein n=1 Tax=Pseudobutyrivibrio sp. TaxID=2014367 RepID=UPI001DE9A6CF|nr:hypothetical protein [Pseudobutyrivibrio sp.]MBE5912367.1 hypothetical protein [Pseudobutyrivibrio sp.]